MKLHYKLFFLLTGALALSAAGAALQTPTDFRTEYAVNPLGLEARRPRLSWKLHMLEDTKSSNWVRATTNWQFGSIS